MRTQFELLESGADQRESCRWADANADSKTVTGWLITSLARVAAPLSGNFGGDLKTEVRQRKVGKESDQNLYAGSRRHSTFRGLVELNTGTSYSRSERLRDVESDASIIACMSTHAAPTNLPIRDAQTSRNPARATSLLASPHQWANGAGARQPEAGECCCSSAGISDDLPQAQCSSGGRFQSRPFPARTAKVMESAGHITKRHAAMPDGEPEREGDWQADIGSASGWNFNQPKLNHEL